MRFISSGEMLRSPSCRACSFFQADRSSGSRVTLVRENETFLRPYFCASQAGTSLIGLPERSMSVSDGRSFSVSGTVSNRLFRR